MWQFNAPKHTLLKFEHSLQMTLIPEQIPQEFVQNPDWANFVIAMVLSCGLKNQMVGREICVTVYEFKLIYLISSVIRFFQTWKSLIIKG